MANISLSGIGSISTEESGRYSLNDFHRASGGEQKHRPKYWLETEATQELVSEISKGGIPPVVVKHGRYGGTYVCKELVYAYAMWISAKFQLKVIRAFDALVQGDTEKAQEIASPGRGSTMPVVKDPRTAALIESLVRIDAVEQQLVSVQQTVKLLEARTQPDNEFFTVAGYARLHGKNVDLKTAASLGRRCSAISKQRDLMVGDVRDPRFGLVHTYHESVLQAGFASAKTIDHGQN